MYSQNDEERFVLEFFDGATGRFLDIGAWDGVRLSNTRRLLEIGWSGVLVEPNPLTFIKMMGNCVAYQSKVTLILAAVSADVGLKKFYIDEAPDREWSATINAQLAASGSVNKPSLLETVVSVVGISSLHCYGPYNFINIDAEWEDFGIIKSMPAAMLKDCKLLCIEPRGVEERAEMKSWFSEAGMVIAYETPENLLVKWPQIT